MDNQLPENNMPQDNLEKTENVFEVVKKLKILNWINWVVLAVIILVVGEAVWYYSSLNQKQITKDFQVTYVVKYPFGVSIGL